MDVRDIALIICAAAIPILGTALYDEKKLSRIKSQFIEDIWKYLATVKEHHDGE